jgi:hypothetical protein
MGPATRRVSVAIQAAVGVARTKAEDGHCESGHCRAELTITVDCSAGDRLSGLLHHHQLTFRWSRVHVRDETPKEGIESCHRSFQRSVRIG